MPPIALEDGKERGSQQRGQDEGAQGVPEEDEKIPTNIGGARKRASVSTFFAGPSPGHIRCAMCRAGRHYVWVPGVPQAGIQASHQQGVRPVGISGQFVLFPPVSRQVATSQRNFKLQIPCV